MNTAEDLTEQIYALLLRGFAQSQEQDAEVRWRWLTAAHIVGQYRLRLHWNSHAQMLAFAAKQKDWPEVLGQLFRLALVPWGHWLGRLPAGNIGRATVNAFTPMPLDARSRALISTARLAASGQSGETSWPLRRG